MKPFWGGEGIRFATRLGSRIRGALANSIVSNFSHVVFTQFDGDIGIKQSLGLHLHTFNCGDYTSRFKNKERETIPFALPQVSRISFFKQNYVAVSYTHLTLPTKA